MPGPMAFSSKLTQNAWAQTRRPASPHVRNSGLAPDGNRCKPQTSGLLQRTPVTAEGFRYIGKETDRRWEQGEDISMLDPHVLEYRPNETARLTTDPDLQRNARQVSIRDLAERAEGERKNREGRPTRRTASEVHSGKA